jgi:hypothetical protein
VDILFVRDWFCLWTYHIGDPSKGSLNRPERKLLPRFNARILKVNQINVTVVTRTDERFSLRRQGSRRNRDISRLLFGQSRGTDRSTCRLPELLREWRSLVLAFNVQRSTFGGGLAKSLQLLNLTLTLSFLWEGRPTPAKPVILFSNRYPMFQSMSVQPSLWEVVSYQLSVVGKRIRGRLRSGNEREALLFAGALCGRSTDNRQPTTDNWLATTFL